ncbi:MAG: hypothetical protein D6781_10470 [Verrucomicrobia bacterium]|nr:MAG: hypothetical protein D6781_10470 [Verrucomicrobiota bacterium]
MPARRYAALLAPDFALQAIARLERGLMEKPVAVLADTSRKALILQVSAAAQAAGVAPGLTATQALTRCPDLVLRHRHPAAETAAQRLLRDAAFALAPRVEATAEGLCTVDLQGLPAGLPLRRRIAGLIERLAGQGLHLQAGLADHPDTARYAALHAAAAPDRLLAVADTSAFLADLPLSLANPEPTLAELLQRWGLRTFGDLARLPRAEIGLRLGRPGLELWDHAAGRTRRLLRLLAPPCLYEELIEWENGIETLEPLLFILRRLVDQLTLRIANAHHLVGTIRLRLLLEDHSGYEQRFQLPEPTADPDTLFRMLHTHLESVRTDTAVTGLKLRFIPVCPSARQQGLFEADLRNPTRFADTLARLIGIVGDGRVGSPRLENTHRPDRFTLVPLETASALGAADALGDSEPPPPVGLPLRRFRPPIPVRVFPGRRTLAPAASEPPDPRVAALDLPARIRDWRGPWRASGEWWESDRRWARDEWDVELAGGGLYRLVQTLPDGRWFIEGTYG